MKASENGDGLDIAWLIAYVRGGLKHDGVLVEVDLLADVSIQC